MLGLEGHSSLRQTFEHKSIADATTETLTLPAGTVEWTLKNLSATLSVLVGFDATDVGASEYWTLEPGETITCQGAGTYSIKNASGGAVIVECFATYLSPEATKRATAIA